MDGGADTSVRFVSGSVEAACGLGLADAVVDLVETGTTMKAAGLEIIAEVMSSEVRGSPIHSFSVRDGQLLLTSAALFRPFVGVAGYPY